MINDEEALEGIFEDFLSLTGLYDIPELEEHIRDTPLRMVKAWKFFLSGYDLNAKDVLSFTTSAPCDEMVVVKDIPFMSFCVHHLVPFVGTAKVGYIPNKRVVGLSKLARLVDMYARRLQIQEMMTSQIANSLQDVLKPNGCGIVISATHMCMSQRGVQKPGAITVTSALLGPFRDEPQTRQEFFSL